MSKVPPMVSNMKLNWIILNHINSSGAVTLNTFEKAYNNYKQGLNSLYCQPWGAKTKTDWAMVAEDLLCSTLSFYSFIFLTLPSQKTQEGHTAPKATMLLKYAKTFTDLEKLSGIIEYIFLGLISLPPDPVSHLPCAPASVSSTNLCLRVKTSSCLNQVFMKKGQ
jgi:hypothetical protein